MRRKQAQWEQACFQIDLTQGLNISYWGGRRVFQQKDRHWRGLFLCLKCLRYVVYVHFERNENFPLGDQILLLSVFISHYVVDIDSV